LQEGYRPRQLIARMPDRDDIPHELRILDGSIRQVAAVLFANQRRSRQQRDASALPSPRFGDSSGLLASRPISSQITVKVEAGVRDNWPTHLAFSIF
jgi:hypothetical protein